MFLGVNYLRSFFNYFYSFHDLVHIGHVLLHLPDLLEFLKVAKKLQSSLICSFYESHLSTDSANKFLFVCLWSLLMVVDVFDVSGDVVAVQEAFLADCALVVSLA